MKWVQASYKKLAEKSSHFVDKLHKSCLHTGGASEGFTDLECYNISFRNCPKILEKANLAFFVCSKSCLSVEWKFSLTGRQ